MNSFNENNLLSTLQLLRHSIEIVNVETLQIHLELVSTVEQFLPLWAENILVYAYKIGRRRFKGWCKRNIVERV